MVKNKKNADDSILSAVTGGVEDAVTKEGGKSFSKCAYQYSPKVFDGTCVRCPYCKSGRVTRCSTAIRFYEFEGDVIMEKKKIVDDSALSAVAAGTGESVVKEGNKTFSECTCKYTPKVFDGTCGKCPYCKTVGVGLCCTEFGVPCECTYQA